MMVVVVVVVVGVVWMVMVSECNHKKHPFQVVVGKIWVVVEKRYCYYNVVVVVAPVAGIAFVEIVDFAIAAMLL